MSSLSILTIKFIYIYLLLKMTHKTITKESDSDYKLVEFLKWGLKDKTLSMLKSFRDRIVEWFKQVSVEDIQDMENRVEEVRWHYWC